jgi:hydrogenase maturation protease
MSSPPILVIGLGSEFRSDDQIGIETVKQLASRFSGNPRIEFMQAKADPTLLIEIWSQRQLVIVVDAFAIAGLAPGSLLELEENDFKHLHYNEKTSSHFLSLKEGLQLGAALGQLPQKILIYGIQGENFNFGEQLSTRVQESIPRLISKIEAQLSSILRSQSALPVT